MTRSCLKSLVFALALLAAGCGSSQKAEKKDPAAPPRPAVFAPASTLLAIAVQGADYSTLTVFKQRLQGLPGVTKLHQQAFSSDEVSQLQVEYVGTSQTLADGIQGLIAQDLPLQVLKFDPSKIEVRVGRKP